MMRMARNVLTVCAAMVMGAAFGAHPLDDAKTVWSGTSGEAPNSVVGDFSSFTARAVLDVKSLPAKGSSVVVFDQWTSDTGWRLTVTYAPEKFSPVTLQVNEHSFFCGVLKLASGKKTELVVTARHGLVAVYQNGVSLQRACHFITPNLEPVKLWRKTESAPPMEGVALAAADFYGADVEYYAKGESKEFATGVIGGKGWDVKVPIDTSRNLPKALCYGDSIMWDYFRELPAMLKGRVYCYSHGGWIDYFGNFPDGRFQEVCSVADYDLVLFNNGLHSLHWTEDKATDAQVKEVYRNFVRVFRKGAPKAKLVYMTTTPENAGGAKPRRVSGRDGTIRRLNRLAVEVMAEEKVEVFDAYAFMLPKLDYARDNVHWDWSGNRILAQRVADEILYRLGLGPAPAAAPALPTPTVRNTQPFSFERTFPAGTKFPVTLPHLATKLSKLNAYTIEIKAKAAHNPYPKSEKWHKLVTVGGAKDGYSLCLPSGQYDFCGLSRNDGAATAQLKYTLYGLPIQTPRVYKVVVDANEETATFQTDRWSAKMAYANTPLPTDEPLVVGDGFLGEIYSISIKGQ